MSRAKRKPRRPIPPNSDDPPVTEPGPPVLTALGIAFGIAVVLAITAVTGYFVAQEFAYMAVDRSRLKARAEAGDTCRRTRPGRHTPHLLHALRRPARNHRHRPSRRLRRRAPHRSAGSEKRSADSGIPTAVGVAVGTVLAVLFSTVIQMVFGELVPEEPRHRAARTGRPVAGTVDDDLPEAVRLADPALRPVVQPAPAGAAHRARPRRRAFRDPPRPRAHRRRVSQTRVNSRRNSRRFSTASSTSPPALQNTP